MQDPYYDEIMKLDGVTDIKRIVNQWRFLSKNLESSGNELPILLPNMLWISKPGIGKTSLLKLISEFLYNQKNILSFNGMVRYFEFHVGYCSPNEDFSELRRLIDTIRQSAGFRGEYKGIVYLDINEWVEHEEDKHFITLLEYLAGNIDNLLIIFCIAAQNDSDTRNIERILSMFFRIDKVILDLPDVEILLDYVKNHLKKYGLSLDSDSEGIIKQAIEALCKSKDFDGYKTLNMLCRDIVYRAFAVEKPKKVITKKFASQFSEESDYMKSTIINIKEKFAIGFRGN